jgi:uncharacterized protein
MVIDIFCHHSTRQLEEMIGKAFARQEAKGPGIGWSPQAQFPFPVEMTTVESRLRIMEEYAIDMQALSQTTPSIYGLGAEDAAEVCSRANDENFILCKAYPKRFVNICILSLLNVKTALDELDRSVDQLDCRGITVATNQNGKGLDSPDYFPFYEKLAAYDLPIFLHPTYWEGYSLAHQVKGWNFMAAFGWPFDTTQAVWRLIFGGVLERFSTLKIVTHHMGAMFPFFSGRVQRILDQRPYFNNIYGDTAISGGETEAYQLGYKFFGPDRLMFGSDFPFGPEKGLVHISANLAGIKSITAPDQDLEKILGGNAGKLLKIK